VCLCSFSGPHSKDEIVISTGAEIGGLLVDGLGDGVLVEAPELPSEELDFLRNMSFGLLQVRDQGTLNSNAATEECWLCSSRRPHIAGVLHAPVSKWLCFMNVCC
jgi:hypothetical protein